MAKKKRVSKDYFGLDWIISVILVIIPPTAWILGALTRFKEGKLIAGLIRLVFGFTIVWILDIIFMFMEHKICRLLNV